MTQWKIKAGIEAAWKDINVKYRYQIKKARNLKTTEWYPTCYHGPADLKVPSLRL